MEVLFGRRRSPEELLRQNQRALSRAVRELERERLKLEAQEKKIIVDIKKMAKQGQMDAVRVLAQDLVRTRRYERKFLAMRANVQGVALRVQTLKSHSAMAGAMRGVTRAMATMNRQVSAQHGGGTVWHWGWHCVGHGGGTARADPEIPQRHGGGHAGRDTGHGHHEPPAEAAADPAHPAGVPEAVGADGHEGGADERRHRRRPGGRGRRGREVGTPGDTWGHLG
uniref:Charged multivesicular body protein 2a n=1 Tax=Taeniopygia guttata TaxID=59729 RepID=A0A674H9B2_TAEGU